MSNDPRPLPAIYTRWSRRRFLETAGVAAFSIVPATVLGRGAPPPSQRLNLAFVGVGGRGAANLGDLAGENVVALCDVDTARAEAARARHPQARFFQDWRRLFDGLEQSLDAVVVSTPDHTHAPVVMAAIRRGKHVFCEKPLARSLREVRTITEAARSHQVATQLGNQGHSSASIREFCEIIHAGAIGQVREVHAFVQNAYCPASRVRPAERPPVPSTLDWESWLGPAPARPYHPAYHPGKWRGWVDFGTGIAGDWTCHVLDPIFWALDLGAPASVRAEAVDYADPRVRAETFPPGCLIRYEFPARGNRPPVLVNWYEGSCPPPRPPELEPGRELPRIGALIVGDQGTILHGSHGAAGTQILPASRWAAYRRPAPTLPRVPGHHADWVRACKGGAPSSANFDYGGPLTEVALLGVLAQHFNGEKLLWDSTALRVPNHEQANLLVNPPWRDGWIV